MQNGNDSTARRPPRWRRRGRRRGARCPAQSATRAGRRASGATRRSEMPVMRARGVVMAGPALDHGLRGRPSASSTRPPDACAAPVRRNRPAGTAPRRRSTSSAALASIETQQTGPPVPDVEPSGLRLRHRRSDSTTSGSHPARCDGSTTAMNISLGAARWSSTLRDESIAADALADGPLAARALEARRHGLRVPASIGSRAARRSAGRSPCGPSTPRPTSRAGRTTPPSPGRSARGCARPSMRDAGSPSRRAPSPRQRAAGPALRCSSRRSWPCGPGRGA